jgi:hypothetical protein
VLAVRIYGFASGQLTGEMPNGSRLLPEQIENACKPCELLRPRKRVRPERMADWKLLLLSSGSSGDIKPPLTLRRTAKAQTRARQGLRAALPCHVSALCSQKRISVTFPLASVWVKWRVSK